MVLKTAGFRVSEKADQCTTVFSTETGDVDLGVFHWLPLATGGSGVCPVKMAIVVKWLRWLEGVAELRVVVHSCFLSEPWQSGADFCPQLPTGARLVPLEVVKHCGGTSRGENVRAQHSSKHELCCRVIRPKNMINCKNRSYAFFLTDRHTFMGKTCPH